MKNHERYMFPLSNVDDIRVGIYRYTRRSAISCSTAAIIRALSSPSQPVRNISTSLTLFHTFFPTPITKILGICSDSQEVPIVLGLKILGVEAASSVMFHPDESDL